MKWLYLPFIFQGICMLVDEFYFHHKRGLPRWERLGHPLDTLTVLAALGYLLLPSVNLNVYLGLSIFSCVFITKDEFVHKEQCPALEQWLHSLLFVLHPILFLSAYLLWQENDFSFLQIQTGIIVGFLFYQILRWSIPWRAISK
jgi:hypothetical protein